MVERSNHIPRGITIAIARSESISVADGSCLGSMVKETRVSVGWKSILATQNWATTTCYHDGFARRGGATHLLFNTRGS